MRISVIGTGYLGAVHAACMASVGHEVIGVDNDPAKIADLQNGIAPFFEPGLQDLLAAGVDSGRLRFTTSLADAAAGADVHFVCVGTPQRAGSQAADMSYVDAVVDGLAPHLDRPCIVVGKSTVPVGTAQRLRERLFALAPVGTAAQLAWNPEFLAEGFAVRDTLEPDRIVVGTESDDVEAQLRELYGYALDAGTPWIRTDLPTAELVKVSANAFLATKISFINAVSEICETAGADVVTLAEAIGHDARIGSRFLRAGVGFGGGCLGKDIRAFMARADELGLGDSVAFLKEVDAVNSRRRDRVVALTAQALRGDVTGRRVAVLGAAFKPNSDDVRDSPALDVAARLAAAGAFVTVHDPEALDNARAVHPELEYANEVEKACADADVVLHLTEWTQYREIDPALLASVTSGRVLIDGRNALDRESWRAAGWTVHALGRPDLLATV